MRPWYTRSMRCLPAILLIALMAAPLCAQRFQLKGEDKDFRADLVRLEDGQVTYRQGRREHAAHIDDFVPASAFQIKRHFTGDAPAARLELARFALHRGLYEDARETAAALAGGEHGPAANGVVEVARVLEADRLLERARKALDELDVETAQPLLNTVVEKFSDTPGAPEAEVLLGALEHVRLAIRARELEQEARAAQEEADAAQAEKRKPIDVWLGELEEQVETVRKLKEEADENCRAGEVFKGLPKYEDAVESLKRIRKSVADNRGILTFPGQDERADEIDDGARRLIVDCYYPWSYYLYRMARYRPAGTVCDHGLRMDPKDTRLLGLRATINEAYDPLED